MPRTLGGGISANTAKELYRKVTLLEITDSTPLRYTDWTQTITQTIESVSRTFTPNVFGFSGIGQSQDRGLLDATLSVQNINGTIGTLIVSAAGVRGRQVQAWEGWYNPDTFAWDDSVKIFDGRLNEVEFDEDTATFTLLPHATPWATRVPGLVYQPACINTFKDVRCQYAGGDTTCDRTFEACQAKSNTSHFNGFRYLPDPSRRLVWQGGSTVLPQKEN